MGLRAKSVLQQQEEIATQQAGRALTLAPGTTWAAPYTQAIRGRVDGEKVRIIQIGDMPGFSPVFLCVGNDKVPTPVRLRDVEITDGAFLPDQNEG